MTQLNPARTVLRENPGGSEQRNPPVFGLGDFFCATVTFMPERWLPIAGYEGMYEVSDLGRVRSLERIVRNRVGLMKKPERILKPQINRDRGGYLQVTLFRDGKWKTKKIHTLVLETFVGPRPPGRESLHANDIETDNRLTNLSWGTRSQNMLDQVKNGRHKNSVKTSCPQGHSYDEVNTRIDNKGRRRCCSCESAHRARRYERTGK